MMSKAKRHAYAAAVEFTQRQGEAALRWNGGRYDGRDMRSRVREALRSGNAEHVLVVEGERQLDRLRREGSAATEAELTYRARLGSSSDDADGGLVDRDGGACAQTNTPTGRRVPAGQVASSRARRHHGSR